MEQSDFWLGRLGEVTGGKMTMGQSDWIVWIPNSNPAANIIFFLRPSLNVSFQKFD